jgi:hypothetical protein
LISKQNHHGAVGNGQIAKSDTAVHLILHRIVAAVGLVPDLKQRNSAKKMLDRSLLRAKAFLFCKVDNLKKTCYNMSIGVSSRCRHGDLPAAGGLRSPRPQ